MTERVRLLVFGLALLAVASVSCAGTGDPRASTEAVAQLEAAVDAARASEAYHVRAVISGDSSSVESTFGGNWEIDVQTPDKLRTIRRIDSKEVQRTVALGGRLFSSDDGGKTWEELEIRGFTSLVPTLLDQLKSICEVEGSLPRLEVSVRSQTSGCEDPQVLIVTLKSGVIGTIEVETPTKLGTVSAIAHYDFTSSGEPITAPSEP